ncbi:MAG: hypothetical protein AAGD23_01010 [Pseudomonadota bacterium]
MRTFVASALIGVMALGMSAMSSLAGNAPSSPANPAITGQQVALLHSYCALCRSVHSGRTYCVNVAGVTDVDAYTTATATCTVATANPFHVTIRRGSCSKVRACH